MQNADDAILPPTSPIRTLHAVSSLHEIAVPLMTFSARRIPFSSAFTAKVPNADWNFFREMDLSCPDLVGTWDVADVCPVQTIDPKWLMTFESFETEEEVKTGRWGIEGCKSDGETESEGEGGAMLSASSVNLSTGTPVSAGSGGMKTSQGSNAGELRSVSLLSSRTTSDDNSCPTDTQQFFALETSTHVFTARDPLKPSYPTRGKSGLAENCMSNNSPSQKEIWSPPLQDETPVLPPSFVPRSISANIPSPITSPKVFVQRDCTGSLSEDEREPTSAPPTTLSNQYPRKEWMTSVCLNPTAFINAVSQSPPISSQSSLVPSLSPSADIYQLQPPQSQKRDLRYVGLFSPSYTESEVQWTTLSPSQHATSAVIVPRLVHDSSISSFAPDLEQHTPQIKLSDSGAVISTPSPRPIPDPPINRRLRVLRESHTTGRKRPHGSDAPPRRSKRLEIDDAAEVKDRLWTSEELGLLKRMKSGPRHSTWREIAAKLNREVGDIKETWRAVLSERQTRDWKVAKITQLAAEHDRIKWGVIATVMGIEIDECISLASELELC